MSTSFQRSPSAPVASELLRQISQTREPLQAPRRVDRPLVLYGAGNLGRMAKDYCDRLDIPIAFVIDARAADHESDFGLGVPVLAPAAVTWETRQQVLLALCVVTCPYEPLAEKLQAEGWIDIVPFYDIAEAYRDRHPLSNGWFAPPLSATDIEQTDRVLATWADDISRAHHLQFLAWRRLRQEWSFADAPVTTDNRFFIPEILNFLHAKESFLDVGAHYGSVTQRFLEVVDGQFNQIWAIEPDPQNAQELRTTLSSISTIVRSQVQIIDAVVGHVPHQEQFYEGLGYASQCSTLGHSWRTVETIDTLALHPTLIKLHLEGAELSALQGARATLQRYRPVIVATVYHNHQGIWELPIWLIDELVNYQYYFRLHSWCGTGAVIYAMPEERSSAVLSF